MKKFIVYIATIFIAFLFLLEIVTRLFHMSGHTLPESNINGNKLLEPYTEGIWVNGGLKEIQSHYKINKQGFNSLKNYDSIEYKKIRIAIIGDSHVEGLRLNVEQSIGRQIEQEMMDKVVVHEYGKSGGNLVDFQLIYQNWVQGNYDYTFIFCDTRDILSTEPAFMGRGDEIAKTTFARNIYNNVSFLRYLNINHKLSIKVKELFKPKEKSFVEKDVQELKLFVNNQALESFDSTTVLVYEKGKLNTLLLEDSKLKMLPVKHHLMPYNHGFDEHWNFNGAKNCAITIKDYLEGVK